MAKAKTKADYNKNNTAKEKRRAGDRQLEIKDICTFYGEAQALKNVTLSVNAGEIVAVLGSNGAGKTTLLRTITGMIAPRDGTIVFRGESIGGLPPTEVIRKGITSVPEGGELFGIMSVSDNLLLGAYSLSRRERREKVPARLDMTFKIFPVLKARYNQKAETLSGGERQMLAVARALMTSPKLLVLDEPSLGLSPLLVTEMMKLLKHICREMKVSILLVEQNAKAALKIADYAYILERGKVVLKGDSHEVMANPTIYSAYLGG
jgi:branched-chain amino acid transport system ATP-binding protein